VECGGKAHAELGAATLVPLPCTLHGDWVILTGGCTEDGRLSSREVWTEQDPCQLALSLTHIYFWTHPAGFSRLLFAPCFSRGVDMPPSAQEPASAGLLDML
jgi:hypothetical protein